MGSDPATSEDPLTLPPPHDPGNSYTDGKSYALTGRIMLSAIVILFFVVILMVFLHLYARWYLLRARRRARNRRASPRTHLVFHFESPRNPNGPRGLDPAVLKSLPVFAYSSGTHPEPVDCAVCLSEFEDGESGRTLPKCNHSFHIECIDMWFHSHSTCPLCRAPVELPENPTPVEPGSSSSACEGSSTESRKPLGLVGITVEVPSRRLNSGFEDESGAESTPSSFRSPVGRMLSFTRILSRERRPVTPPPSSSCAFGGGFLAEVDLERGREENAPETTRG